MENTGAALQKQTLPYILIGAFVLSVISFAYFFWVGLTLAYADAESHMIIAKLVQDARENNGAQLGSTWLLGQHVLMQPLVAYDYLYYTGIGGSLWSMVGFVATTIFVYKTTIVLTHNNLAGIISGLVFATNLNVLYMQSTPMTELLLFTFTIASVYYLLCWSMEQDHRQAVRYLMATWSMVLCATLVRYEGWVLYLSITAAFFLIGVRKGYHWDKLVAHVIYPAFFGGAGIFFWIFLWNWPIFGNPLDFQQGEYSKPSLWVETGEKTTGNLEISVMTYLRAMSENIGLVLIGLAGIGYILFLLKSKVGPEAIAISVLLFPAPFFIVMLYQGQRPMHVPQYAGDLYNLRFALQMILPVSIFVGVLIGILEQERKYLAWSGRIVVTAGLVFTTLSMLATDNIITLEEAIQFRSNDTAHHQSEAAEWLLYNYDGGKILMETFGNTSVTFQSRIPLDQLVHEGLSNQWKPALTAPEYHNIRWIYMRTPAGREDKTFTLLRDQQRLADNYILVFKNEEAEIYRARLESIGSR